MKIMTEDHLHDTGEEITLDANLVTIVVDEYGDHGVVITVTKKDTEIKLDSIEVSRGEMGFINRQAQTKMLFRAGQDRYMRAADASWVGSHVVRKVEHTPSRPVVVIWAYKA